MLTSRSLPQQTAQICSPFAGQKRAAFRFPQIGQVTGTPHCYASDPEYAFLKRKRKSGSLKLWLLFESRNQAMGILRVSFLPLTASKPKGGLIVIIDVALTSTGLQKRESRDL